jgi:RNA polymerase sigma-70 factor (ECF subfamily)
MPEPIQIVRDDPAAAFEPHRAYLRGLAYRMLSSMAEAEDAVQDAYIRWHRIGAKARTGIENPRAWLSKATTRLCLDRLKSARAQRESYVGPWLPEPVIEPEATEDPAELAQDLSVAFLLLLERLSPLERAAFLLHDVFDLGFDEVAARLGRSAAACRQLASRARAHVQAAQARVEVRDEEAQGLLAAFAGALRSSDVGALATLLADDAQMLSDGGGQVAAVPRPVRGAARVAQVMAGFARLWNPATQPVAAARINGLPGVVMRDLRGHALQTMAFALSRHADGRACVAEIYVVRNPDKLAHVREPQEQP